VQERKLKIIDLAYTAAINIDELTAISLAMGDEINFNDQRYVASCNGDLFALGITKN